MLQASACDASLRTFHVNEQSWFAWNVFLQIVMLFGVFDNRDSFSPRTKGGKGKTETAFHENKSPKGFRETAIRFLWVRKNRRRTLLVMRCSPVLWIYDCYPNLRSALQQVVRQAMQGLVLQGRSSLSH